MTQETLDSISRDYLKLKQEMAKVIVGQDEIIDQLVIALLAKGHCLLIGVPGLAKTLLIQTLGQVTDLDSSRIQFTPDLMPGDITGTEILDIDPESGARSFKFVKGPVFSNLILADEINRTPPKTQSALLEAMQEKQVTSAGKRYSLPVPFFVMATQNPIEQEGTYPLPEAQLDRFMFSLLLGYPTEEQEREVIRRTTSGSVIKPNQVLSREKITEYQAVIPEMPVSDWLADRVVRLVNMTRTTSPWFPEKARPFIRWGAGPRASQSLILASKVRAALMGKKSPDWEDVQFVVKPILRHRIILTFSAEAEGLKPDELIDLILTELDRTAS